MSKRSECSTILLVEDSIDDYEATVRSFREAHLRNQIKWCKSGEEALDYLRHEGTYASSTEDSPTLILLDLNMPGLGGRQILTILKQEPAFKTIPVVILTASADEKGVTKCYELGASTYIQKPVEFNGLVEAIGRLKNYWFGLAVLPVHAS